MLKTYRRYHRSMKQYFEACEDHDAYFEVPYTEYRVSEDGIYTVEGTEDFSSCRLRRMICERAIHMPTGKLDKGGHRRWYLADEIQSTDTKAIRAIANIIYAGREFSIRQY